MHFVYFIISHSERDQLRQVRVSEVGNEGGRRGSKGSLIRKEIKSTQTEVVY